MKEFKRCKICNSVFFIGDVIHEVPNIDGEMIKLCSDCYTSIYRQWRVK